MADSIANTSEARWLLLIHQIPPKPNYLRVKINRRLQRVGAAPIKNSVYALPRRESTLEDFEWVAREIREGGGDATVCEARFVDGLSDTDVESLFREAREADYREIATESRSLQRELRRRRRKRNSSAEGASKLARLRKSLVEIDRLDFFGAPGREAAEGLVRELEDEAAAAVTPAEPVTASPAGAEAPRGRTWVTRNGVHVDRMASAWLIRRFVDPEARLKFVPSRGYRPEGGEIRFDMFEAEYTHEGDRCTFEVLVARFGLADPALGAIGEIVHDVDLKDSKFDRPETAGVESLVTGIAIAHKDDDARIASATVVLDGLYEYFHRRASRR